MPIDMFFQVSTIVVRFNVKAGFFGARFKLNIQEVPAEYANQAGQIIEEARISGSYPVLPALDGYLEDAPKLEAGQMKGQRNMVKRPPVDLLEILKAKRKISLKRASVSKAARKPINIITKKQRSRQEEAVEVEVEPETGFDLNYALWAGVGGYFKLYFS